MHIIIYGDPVDGLKFIGPFNTSEEAAAYASSGHFDGYDWWVAPLEASN